MSGPPERRVDASRTHTISISANHAPQPGAAPLGSLVIQHDGDTTVAPLHSGVSVIVGRAPSQGVRVEHGTLSREHARFELAGERVIVTDLDSKNGVRLGQRRVPRAELAAGEAVMLGAVCVRFQLLGATRIAEPSLGDAPRAVGSRVTAPDAGDIVGAHMRALVDDVGRVAASRIPIILYGETGTGKEVLARAIHERSARRGKRLICVNCGAIPRDLVESTLFGHERGAFTGAQQQHRGVFEEASRGTVFLDEIGELPLSAQVALLRVLETGGFSRVGAVSEVTVDVRVIAATHRDLDAMVRDGTFRADLYYRLSGASLKIAPLRERIEDVEPLAMRFLSSANQANGRAVQGITRDALAALGRYGWPGNVRELRNVVERAVVITTGEWIDVHDLPRFVREPLAAGTVRSSVRSYEAAKLRAALEAAGWNRGKAAEKLEMPVRTLSYRMKLLGVKRDE